MPECIAALVAVTKFDRVIVVSDVTAADRDLRAQIRPPIDAKFLTLDENQELTIADLIRSHLAR